MECQVNVAQDGGDRIDGEFKGRKWHGWTDGMQTWKSFRIPYKANTDPEYEDRKMVFDLEAHAEGIGMTGWNWKQRISKWVAYDFDAITGHSDKHESKLSNMEIQQVEKVASDIPWVTLRRSTSGKGLHLYVFVNDIETKNHNEHAALARAILGKMSSITGFDFSTKVDICGGNMWVWHRKMKGTEGLNIIKQGSILTDIPTNWHDHVKVVIGRRRRILPKFIHKDDEEKLFEELTGQRPGIELDEEHLKLIKFLEDKKTQSWWDSDHHMLVTHTFHLKEAYEELQFRGIFTTNAKGTEYGRDHNCFLFPLRRGGWIVRRYSPGVQETDTWDQDASGYTRCYFNREPDLGTASRANEGIEHPTGGYVFRHADFAIKAGLSIGVDLKLPNWARGRQTKLKLHKDGRLIAEVDRDNQDLADDMRGWLPDKSTWKRIFNAKVNAGNEPDVGNFDDILRHIVAEEKNCGWVIKSGNMWHEEPLNHVKPLLESEGATPKEATIIIGQAIEQPWKLVNIPFQPEYPGERRWNRNSAQLKYTPSQNKDDLQYPTWLKILEHCGAGLDMAIQNNPWAKVNGILNGADYLKCWVASIFQEPLEPLPYLFLYGPQNSGKSILHEGLGTLLTRGSVRADNALISQAGFNGELENSIICIVEETDLRKHRVAYNRIKDWVTAKDLPIHRKQKTPYSIPNSTHWIQCANDYQACPIFPGDTRITMSYVSAIDPIDLIPKKQMIPLLEKEAPDFLAEVLTLELPPSNDRLNVPVIVTEDKIATERTNQTMLEMFVDDKCYGITGEMIKFSEFYERFQEWLDPNEIHNWSKVRVGREIPPHFPKGRLPQTGEHWLGNISWEMRKPEDEIKSKLIIQDGKLVYGKTEKGT